MVYPLKSGGRKALRPGKVLTFEVFFYLPVFKFTLNLDGFHGSQTVYLLRFG
jgi:hypothetical protein